MYGVLNINWVPTAEEPEPADGQIEAIVRGDTFAHEFPFWSDEEQTVPFDIEGTVTAQIRSRRLKNGATVGTPDAVFSVLVVDNVVTVSLTPAQTQILPTNGFWDLQQSQGGVVTTLLAGATLVVDDVTRPNP